MTWFFAIVIVAVIGVVAVVATGSGGTMVRAFDDRPDARVQADGPLSANDLRRVRFSTAFRGYRMSEVDALLDRLSLELEPPHTELREPEPFAPEPREPELRGPELRGPELRGPELRGPELRGPELLGPELRAPELRAPEPREREA